MWSFAVVFQPSVNNHTSVSPPTSNSLAGDKTTNLSCWPPSNLNISLLWERGYKTYNYLAPFIRILVMQEQLRLVKIGWILNEKTHCTDVKNILVFRIRSSTPAGVGFLGFALKTAKLTVQKIANLQTVFEQVLDRLQCFNDF